MGGTTLGNVGNHISFAVAIAARVSIAIFGLIGLWLAATGITDAANLGRRAGRDVSPAGPIAKIIGSIFCFSIPTIAGISWGTLFSFSTPMQMIGAQASGTSKITDCLSAATGTNPAACAMHNLAVSAAPAMMTMIAGFAALAGLWMIANFVRGAVGKAAGNGQAQVKWGNLFVGILFMGLGAVVNMLGATMGFSAPFMSSGGYAELASYLAYVPTSFNLTPQYAEMVAAGYVILAVFGFFEVVRGGFILAHSMNPNAQFGMGGKASVHIIFGVALVFLPVILQAFVLSSLGPSAL